MTTALCQVVWALCVALSANLPCSTPGTNPAAPLSPLTGGVYSTTPSVFSLVAEGMERSPTFARIVSDLRESDVLATIEPDLRIKRHLRGYLVFVTRVSTRRYVRIYFDPQLRHVDQIATIGHELRHAVEVGSHPEVIDQATLRLLYVTIGFGYGDKWDSDPAIDAGHIIAHELTAATTLADER